MRSLLVPLCGLVVASFACLGACSRLTSPPAPEPIASDTPVVAASAPIAVASNVRPFPSALRHPPPNSSAANAGAQPSDGAQLKIEDLVVGSGAEVHPHDVVTVHYTGTLLDGTKFDSSRDRNKPIETPIPGNLIQGWNKGILGMKVGGRRKLTIPPSLGYGAQPQRGIPPNSTLVFDIELLDVKQGPARPHPVAPQAGQ